MANLSHKDRLRGLIYGTAIADSVALPFENMSARRVQKWLGDRPVEQSLFFGRGMISDDTELCCIIVEAFLANGYNESVANQPTPDSANLEALIKGFSSRYLKWFLTAPIGIGGASLKSGLRHLFFFSKTGINSAGNGAAMRAPILGLLFHHDAALVARAASEIARVTHTDQRAVDGSVACALAAQLAMTPDWSKISVSERVRAARESIVPALKDHEFIQLTEKMLDSASNNGSAEEFASETLKITSVSGYVNHSVPVALHVWLESPTEFEAGVVRIMKLGGDTDTNAAIFGALAGATAGHEIIPERWRNRLTEWPRDAGYFDCLAESCADGRSVEPTDAKRARFHGEPGYLALCVRSALLWILIFLKLGRRMLPPW